MAEKTSREKTIAATYAEIQRCDQNGEFERALKAANRSKNPQVSLHFINHCNGAISSSSYGATRTAGFPLQNRVSRSTGKI